MERPEGENPAKNRPVADAERQIFLRQYEGGYIFRKDMRFKPNISLPWYEQILELEGQGKPTSVTAHEMAIEAREKNGWKREPKALPVEQDDFIPF